ncbi:MAG: hypothetical protein KAY24_14350 [Candidatus Eisenbacteria sp.]|nr:hypothetical protein [Candidatus Eisenbacteria bacterium]
MRYLIAVLCGGLIVLRGMYQGFEFDNISLGLLVLAAILLVLGNPDEIRKRLKRLKVGSVELELHEQVRSLVKRAGDVVEEESVAQGPEALRLPDDVREKLVGDAENPRAVLLLLASEIEKRVVELSNKHEILRSASKGVPVIGTVNILVQRGVLEGKALHLLQDFWNVRNRVVHSIDTSLSETELYGLVEVGIRIVRLLYQEDKPYEVESDYR